MVPRMLRVLGSEALALRGHGLGTEDWGLVFLLAVVVSTFFGVEAEVEGSGYLRAQLIALGMGYSVQVGEVHYVAWIIEGDLKLKLE